MLTASLHYSGIPTGPEPLPKSVGIEAHSLWLMSSARAMSELAMIHFRSPLRKPAPHPKSVGTKLSPAG